MYNILVAVEARCLLDTLYWKLLPVFAAVERLRVWGRAKGKHGGWTMVAVMTRATFVSVSERDEGTG